MLIRRFLLSIIPALLISPAALSAGQAVLWIPAGDADIGVVLSILEANTDLRLTVALPAAPKGLEDRIKVLSEEGRLELARRPAGDPPLPLLYYPAAQEVRWEGKPQEVAEAPAASYFLSLRLGMARDEASLAFGAPPTGFVSPPGGLAADYFPLAGALGVKWIACGPSVSTAAAVMQSGGVYAVPFVKFSTAAPSFDSPAFTLFDETSAPDPAVLGALLAEKLTDPDERGWLTVSEALKVSVSTSASPAEVSGAVAPWSGDYSRWASAPLQAGALAAMARTRSDLMLYLNSEQGNFLQAEPAFREYFSAEEGDRLLVMASTETAGEAELELRNTLANVYRLMHKPPPPWAFSSLADAASGDAGEDKISVAAIPGGFELTNIARPASAPMDTPGLPASADPAGIWKLSGLRVSDSPEGTLFQFRPAQLDNSLKKPSGFSHIRLDLYMDVNNRPRAGIPRPLEGRPLRFIPENAWEYALEVTPDGATLYKITPGGASRTGSFKSWTEAGWIKVLVPASSLRGSPALWSYAALLLAPKDGGYTIADYIADDIARGYIYSIRPGKK